MIFRINECSIDTNAYEVRRNGKVVPVEPQVFDLLMLLLENRDRLVTKDEINHRIWRGRAVSDAALNSRIKSARQTIGDSGASQQIIRTIRGRGFRFVGEVRPSPIAAAGNGKAAAAAPAIPGDTPMAALGMPAGPRVAVLRFNNVHCEAKTKFLGDAIVEEIATQLTRYSELRVAARALTAECDSADANAGDIGRRLGVEFLVVGSLRQANDRMRVTAHLIRVVDGQLLWAQTYEPLLTPADIFAIEDEIASKIVAAIASISAGVIARETLGKGRGKPPSELSAYESVVRANEVMQSGFSATTHLATRACLEAAVAREPDYAAAWAVLAWVHTLEYTYGYNMRAGTDPLEAALVAARRAINLAPANPVARFAMARTAYVMRDLHLFYAEASNALNLNPHDPLLLGNLGNWLAFSGRWDQGVALVRKAISLNPNGYPRWWHAALGKDHYRKGEFREALAEFTNMNLPGWWWNQVELAYTYGQLGDVENARLAVSRLLDLYRGFDIETAVMEHRVYSFPQSYIDLAVDGLRKAGLPERSAPALAAER
ncbi:winged helix-turn-helix domain-containing protein [Bradyrhizobium sp.]|uniref:winged helix-turn-helix domain-containing tetratricopeptide repeat protein n=1 Tax=Bradyrhizobium sp. TaxID=376 RepID=UPI0025C0F78C|nr:winged helix-turn-helix domain-containing protein [Bradyrhizobium sp.]